MKQQKLEGVTLPHGVMKPAPSTSLGLNTELEEYKEVVDALQKLFEGSAAPASTTVTRLLDDTRPHRNLWLRTAVSIETILQTYPVFEKSRWVSDN